MSIVSLLDILSYMTRGWDWGPVLSPCGPWRAVRLEIYEARISDIRVDYQVDPSLKSVAGSITTFVEGAAGSSVDISVTVGETQNQVFKGTAQVSQDGLARVEFHVNEPHLWYPHGYGEAYLYDVHASLRNNGTELSNASRKTGFRKLELVQQKDEIGKSFYFRVNNIDVFCGGSDWIPADSFTPRISADRYRRWLQMMVDGYQLMIRYDSNVCVDNEIR